MLKSKRGYENRSTGAVEPSSVAINLASAPELMAKGHPHV